MVIPSVSITAVAPENSPVIVSPSSNCVDPSPNVWVKDSGLEVVTNRPLAPDVLPFILSPRSKVPVISLTVSVGVAASVEVSSES